MYFLQFVVYIFSSILNQKIHIVYFKLDLFRMIFLFFSSCSKTSGVYSYTQTLVIVWNKEGRKQILNSKNKLLQQINVCCNGCFQSWIFMVELRRVCATLNFNHNKLKGCSVFCIMTLKRLKLKVSFYRRRNWHSFRMLNRCLWA